MGVGGSRLGSATRLSLVALVASLALAPLPAHAAFPGANGKLAIGAIGNAGRADVFTMNPDGGGLANLTNNPAYDSGASWSPDGTRIAFESDRDSSGSLDIYVMDADGSQVTRLTSGPGGESDPAWSPDGQRIVYSGQGGLYTMNADGTSQTLLLAGLGARPVWSPDGTKIAFQKPDRR
jgi:Tol biopolymer transport system component